MSLFRKPSSHVRRGGEVWAWIYGDVRLDAPCVRGKPRLCLDTYIVRSQLCRWIASVPQPLQSLHRNSVAEGVLCICVSQPPSDAHRRAAVIPQCCSRGKHWTYSMSRSAYNDAPMRLQVRTQPSVFLCWFVTQTIVCDRTVKALHALLSQPPAFRRFSAHFEAGVHDPRFRDAMLTHVAVLHWVCVGWGMSWLGFCR